MCKIDATLRRDLCLTALCWDSRLLAHPPNTNTSPSGPEHAVCHSLKHKAQSKERSTYTKKCVICLEFNPQAHKPNTDTTIRLALVALCDCVWKASTHFCSHSTAKRHLPKEKEKNKQTTFSWDQQSYWGGPNVLPHQNKAHSVSLCLWWNLQTRRCGLVTREWRSAKTGRQDHAGERSYRTVGRVRGKKGPVYTWH